MGDFNIDVTAHSNKKWRHLIDLFDVCQMIRKPTRVTETTSTIIDHVYTSHPDNIKESFVSPYSISDHFPVCFTRKSNRISKSKHVTTKYRCFKNLNEDVFIANLSSYLNFFVNEDLSSWYDIVLKHLNQHAPYKTKRVKTSKLPDWYNDEIAQARRKRDDFKRRKLWADFKTYRN